VYESAVISKAKAASIATLSVAVMSQLQKVLKGQEAA
jgi:hypothetical protein